MKGEKIVLVASMVRLHQCGTLRSIDCDPRNLLIVTLLDLGGTVESQTIMGM